MSNLIADGLEVLDVKKWKNKHENFVHKFEKPRSYKLTNPDRDSSSFSRYLKTTKNIQKLIGDAILNKKEIRAIGRGWSFTKVAVGKHGFVDTLALRLNFKMRKSQLHSDFIRNGGKEDDLRFIQCGNSILSINSLLEKRLKSKRSIIASGASNGQTIAGATSTGTHGGAFNTGSVHDAIVGLHIVTDKDRHIYVERGSDKCVNDSFIKALEVDEHIVDDEIFNSAVVSFGSFGIIHGVMLKTEPIFLLEKYRSQVSYTQEIKKGLDDLDFSKFNLTPAKDGTSPLYHFQVLINPYKTGLNEKGVYLTYMYKVPYFEDPTREDLKKRGYTYGDDTLGILAKLLESKPPILIKTIVNKIVDAQFPKSEKFPWIGTMGQTFNYTSLKGKTASCAIAVDKTDTTKVVDIALSITKSDPFFGVFALRYVKGTQATLGFTRFPTTCVIELDGSDTKSTRKFYKKVCEELKKQNIAFTLHWGKINDFLFENSLSDFYDRQKIDAWKRSRTKVFAGSSAQKIFDNQYIRDLNLE